MIQIQRKVLFLSLFTIFLLIWLIASQKELLFQEGNPVKLIWGLIRLETSDSEIIQISEKPAKYIMQADSKGEPFFQMMEIKGWTYDTQFGNGLVFKKNDQKITVIKRNWTRRYLVVTDPSLADETPHR